MSKHLGSTATAAPEQQEEAWLTKCKSETLKSSEWRELVASVFKETKTELSKRHIVFFSELTHEEKADCMEDVQSSLKGSREFQKMIVMLRHSVDVGLSEAITAEIAAGKHPASATKIDVLMKKASTAATGLLADWPRNHQHLSLMLNRGLTGTLRRPSWELFLSRKDARAHYEEKISKQPSSTISSKDLEILQKCQRLLVSDFAAVAGSSRLAVTVMKTVISYCHVLSRNDEFLSDSSELLHLLVPLLAVFQDCCAAGDAKSLIEHYLALLVMVRPDVFSGYSSLVTVPPASASIPVIGLRDTQLHAHLTATGEHGDVATMVLAAVHPLHRNLYVGGVTLDVVYFIWDQCLLSNFSLLPAITAALITLARAQLLQAHTEDAVNTAILSTAGALTVASLQRELQARYQPELKAAGMPDWDAKLGSGPDAPLLFGDDILELSLIHISEPTRPY
eukprot:TRINITY_DN12770_c0_g1_i1.p1 TRINITY_DN12770_c0_g1~~TRINITY_DN12770_c0_g1_i1.p1  ORF type:complete len:452 (-),score=115.87 TRINITY_DN12770_c0_g1_i1:68-1423(-)